MIKCYCGHYYDMKGDETRWCSRDTLHAVAECVGGRDMHDRLRTRLAESEAEVENQRRLRMLAEEAIPKGVEVARDYFAAEIQALRTRLAESEAEVGRLIPQIEVAQSFHKVAVAEVAVWKEAAQEVANLFDPAKPEVSAPLLRAVAKGAKSANQDLRAEVEKLKREEKDIGAFIDAALADRDAFEDEAEAKRRCLAVTTDKLEFTVYQVPNVGVHKVKP